MTDTELKSCIGTIEMLRRLAYNIHGVMDVIDADNCEKIIKVLSDIPKYKDAYNKGWDDGAKATYEHLKMCEEEEEPCEDEYIKVPKKALKYRTAGMVAYNVEWLKNHFDIERAVFCGAQEQSGDLISRQAVLHALYEICDTGETLIENPWRDNPHIDALVDTIEQLTSVRPQESNIVALGEELRMCQNSITDEKVLIGFNMAVALCNKHLGESEVQE